MRWAPTARMSLRASLPLWLPRFIENDDVARAQNWNEYLLDVDEENLAVDRAIDDEGSLDAVVAQGSDEGQGLPMPMWRIGLQGPPARSPATQRYHVRLDPRLVDEQQTPAIDTGLVSSPARSLTGDVWGVYARRPARFFLKLSPWSWTNTHTARKPVFTLRSPNSSTTPRSVKARCDNRRSNHSAASPESVRFRCPPILPGANCLNF